jgi:hypothetical protein
LLGKRRPGGVSAVRVPARVMSWPAVGVGGDLMRRVGLVAAWVWCAKGIDVVDIASHMNCAFNNGRGRSEPRRRS